MLIALDLSAWMQSMKIKKALRYILKIKSSNLANF